ncbi:CHAT domain-containing protein [Streptomyces sp. NBC_01275]|uniref:CHAT domain-containing protein n=1 Tax=Streptomyces sp. NBC_01275 TaxID=2903807 RepID=UPI0022539207|nr:CHAT domain-containing protein [Streptomyces sp. NBC_01275]MCX4765110.1 CHAT domain-containing protein [Streptomyces sp. NBC_01275]
MGAESRVDAVGRELMKRAGLCVDGRVDAAFVAGMEEIAAEIDAATREFETLLGELLADEESGTAAGLRTTARTTGARRRADAREWVARAYDSLGNPTEAVRRYELAEKLYARLGDETAVQRCRDAAARTRLYSSGNVDAEIRRLTPGTEEAARTGDMDALGRLVQLGQLYVRGGDVAEARRIFEVAAAALDAAVDREASAEEALEEFVGTAAGDGSATSEGLERVFDRARLAVRISTLRQTLNIARAQIADDPREARRHTEAARAEWSVSGFDTSILGEFASYHDQIAGSSAAVGEFAASLARIDGELHTLPTDAVLVRLGALRARARELGVVRFEAAVGRRQGDLLLRTGRPLDALAVLREALGLLDDRSRHDLQPVLLARIAACHAAVGDWPGVSQAASRGIALVEAHRYDVSGTYMKDFYLKDRIDLYRLLVEAAYYAKDAERVFRAAELSKARRLASAATRPEPERIGQITELGRLIHESAPGSTERAELTLHRRLLWDYVLAGGDHGDTRPVPTLSAVQQALRPDEAVLYHYWLDDSRLIVALIRRERKVIGLRTLPPGSREELDRLVRLIRPTGNERVRVDIDGPLAASAQWLLPADQEVLAGCTRLYVSPHGILHSLPIHALPWGEGILLDAVSVTYLPNLSGLVEDEVQAPGPGTVVAGIGRFADPSLAPRERLADAAREIGDLHRAAGRPVEEFTDEKATKRSLLELKEVGGALRSAGCVSLLTHGASVDAETPMESILWLHDSALDGLEISLWPLAGALVTLTACCSGQRAITMADEQALPGDEVFGLQAALFAAGASAVLGALWPIRSKECVKISTLFHKALVIDGQAPDQALRTAIREFRRTAGLLQRPAAVWAPLFLVSRGRPRPLGPGIAHV